MCVTIIHTYCCSHKVTEKAPCATSWIKDCGVLLTKSIKHDDSCDRCENSGFPSSQPKNSKAVFDLFHSVVKITSTPRAALDEDGAATKPRENMPADGVSAKLRLETISKRSEGTSCCRCKRRNRPCDWDKPTCTNCKESGARCEESILQRPASILDLNASKGCLRCRMRKIKCGKEKPICQNCSNIKIGCHYPDTDSKDESPTGESLRDQVLISTPKLDPSRARQLNPMEMYLSIGSETEAGQKGDAAEERIQRAKKQNDDVVGRRDVLESATGGDASTKKRRGRVASHGRCHSCNRSETPEWRRGPDGARTLCNTCGLNYAKLTREMRGKLAMTSSKLRPTLLDRGQGLLRVGLGIGGVLEQKKTESEVHTPIFHTNSLSNTMDNRHVQSKSPSEATASLKVKANMAAIEDPQTDDLVKSMKEEVTPTSYDSAATDSGSHGSQSSDISSSTEEDNGGSVLEIRRRVVDHVMAYFHSIFRTAPLVPRRRQSKYGHQESAVHGVNKSLGGAEGDISTSHHHLGKLGLPSAAGLLNMSPFVKTYGKSCGSSKQSSGPTARATASMKGGVLSNSVPSTSYGLGKHARQNDHNSRSDEDDDGNPPKRPRKDKMAYSTEYRRKFACPFFKRDSEKYRTHRSCVGPGWDEVRRVKEHLYRNHALPVFCSRCYETFKVEARLHDHQRAIEPCTRRPTELIEGFDKSQEKRLRSRKKMQPELSEEGKWKEMYRILFPADDEAMMPSPYLDADWVRIHQRGRQQNHNDELARYEEFLRRELPVAVRRELENAVEREFSPMEERLKSQLIEIVRDLQLQLFQSYTRTRNTESAAPIETVRSASASLARVCPGESDASNPEALSTAVTTAEPAEVNAPSEAQTIENQLASFEPPPPLEESSTFDFDPVLFQFHEFGGLREFEDSAYGSMFAESAYSKAAFDYGSEYINDYRRDFDNGEGPSGTR